MLNLEELKQALEHDSARRQPPEVRPNYAGARAQLKEALLAIEHASLLLATQPAHAVIVAQFDDARAALARAEAALMPQTDTTVLE